MSLTSPRPIEVQRGEEWQSMTDYRRIVVPVSGTLAESIPMRRTSAEPVDVDLTVESDEDLLGLRPEGLWRVVRASAVLHARKRLP